MVWANPHKHLELNARQAVTSGKYWIVIWLGFRSTLIIFLGKDAFKDQLDRFVCDTRMIGCEEMCFNAFSPVSLQRYWLLQMLVSAMPPIMYIIYSMHVMDQVSRAMRIRKKVRLKQRRDIYKFQKALRFEELSIQRK